VNLKKN